VTRKIPEEQCAVIGANIRALRQRHGWTQARLGALMGWDASTVCAAEGHRSGRQRGFTTADLIRLAAVFGVPPAQITTRCATCGGRPPAGYACLACGATPGPSRPAASAPSPQEQPGHAAAGR
jgi:transcriptional regulator with XRE-family HTH domain